MDSGEPQNTTNLVAECVQNFWNQQRRPMLLSSLGTALDAQTMREVRHVSGNLATYIRMQLPGSVSVVKHSTNPTIIAAIPSSEAHFTQDWDHLLARPPSDIDKRAKRFNRVFWTAFRKPLDDSSARFLSCDGPIRFVDVPPGTAPPGSLEIPQAYIPGDAATDSDVAQRIADWLGCNNLEETPFLYTPRSPRQETAQPLPADDLFGRLILAFEPDELDNVAMPIALVAKLRRTPV